MQKYLLINENENTGDVRVYDSIDEANEDASMYWRHLTAAEKEKTHIFVALVTEDCLADYAADEDGERDWTACSAYYQPDEAFDSEKEAI